jgi:hypothetical protein
MYDEWLAYYHANQVTAIHGGLIAMRRRTGSNWLSIEEIAGNIQQPFGDLIGQRFANRDFLITHADDALLLQSKIRLHPETRLQQEKHWENGDWQVRSLRLSLARDLTQTVGIDDQIAEFIAQLDGAHTLQELIDAIIQKVQADPQQVTGECLRSVRFLLERGLLLA